MALTYYDNLDGPETHRSDILALLVHRNLSPVVNYVQKAIRAIQRDTHYLKWDSVSSEELEKIFLNNTLKESDEPNSSRTIRERIEKGFWIRISEEESHPLPENVLNSFYEARWVYDSNNFREHGITVIDSDEEMELLCLERKPTSEEDHRRIYLQPNTTGLNRQYQAILELENRPHPSQRGLYRLFEAHDHANWDDVSGVRISSDGWFVLNSDRPGTEEQKRFVRIALGTPDFAILEGPPGSGKTVAITELILQYIKRGKRILLCASTHVAVDNVLERVMDSPGVFAVRVGMERNLSTEVAKLQVENRMDSAAEDIIRRLSTIEHPSPSQKAMMEIARRQRQSSQNYNSPFFRLMLESANLVSGTTIGVISQMAVFQSLKEGRTDPLFDVLILDEASKTTFPEFLVPAVLAKKWIITGDTKQLSPYVDNDEIVANIEYQFPNEKGQQAALISLLARGRSNTRGQPSLVVTEDFEYAVLIGLQCLLSGIAVAVFNNDLVRTIDERFHAGTIGHQENTTETHSSGAMVDGTAGDRSSRLACLGCEIFIASEAEYVKYRDCIPHDISNVLGTVDDPQILGKIRWFLSRFQQTNGHQSWSDEVAWRLSRLHELRLDPSNPLVTAYNEEINTLMPKAISEKATEKLMQGISEIKGIALPSIIELLQYGYEIKGSQPNALNKGIPAEVLEARHVRLSYQHRMHPDISRFPRQCFYAGLSLKDPSDMIERRKWDYEKDIGESRVSWLDHRFRSVRPSRINYVEADMVLDELERFTDWASNHSPPDGACWEVAVLTFYKGQEKLLRKMVADFLMTIPRRTFWYPHRNTRKVRIEICTVDRFQGHEADLVILSLVRTRSVGFLDSPNRMNVALTRAKYQLLLIGNRGFFKRATNARALNEIALSEKVVPTINTYKTETGAKYTSFGRKKK